MGCRGVFFAIDAGQAEGLLAARGDEEVMAAVEAVEEAWDEDNLAECDKSWDALHRALTDGRLEFGNGPYPLSHCVLGPRQLHQGDEYIVSFVSPGEVRDVSAALEALDEEGFRRRYRTLVPQDYSEEYGGIDIQYTWDWYQGVRELYRKAAERGRAVIFTVGQ